MSDLSFISKWKMIYSLCWSRYLLPRCQGSFLPCCKCECSRPGGLVETTLGCHEQSRKVVDAWWHCGDIDIGLDGETVPFPHHIVSHGEMRICQSEIIDGRALAALSLASLARKRKSKHLIARCIDHPCEGGLHQSFFYKIVYSYNLLSTLDCVRQNFCKI